MGQVDGPGREAVVVLEHAVEEGVGERLLVADGPQAVVDLPPDVKQLHHAAAMAGCGGGRPAALAHALLVAVVGHLPARARGPTWRPSRRPLW
uniref:Uncharacterized protein n=1 Tax=Triticum urartu TaxID=4572 RepID=A0A8R7PZS7_TRIUA